MHKNKTLCLWLPTGYPCLSQATDITPCFLFTMDSLLSFESFPVVSQELFSVHCNDHVGHLFPPQTGLQEGFSFTCAQPFAKTACCFPELSLLWHKAARRARVTGRDEQGRLKCSCGVSILGCANVQFGWNTPTLWAGGVAWPPEPWSRGKSWPTHSEGKVRMFLLTHGLLLFPCRPHVLVRPKPVPMLVSLAQHWAQPVSANISKNSWCCWGLDHSPTAAQAGSTLSSFSPQMRIPRKCTPYQWQMLLSQGSMKP